MLHVCCIRAGEIFSPAYVSILKDMVVRNLVGGDIEGRFVCFTDRAQELEAGIETAPLPADLPRWWSKLALFRKELFPEGDRVLFFDLDTVITGSIDQLASYDGKFATLRDFYRPNGLQSAVMAWRAGEQSQIWESYERAGCPMDIPGGDQTWIEAHAEGNVRRLQDIFPKMFVSFKQMNGAVSKETSVVVFHGLPRPHQVTDDWVPKVWKIGGLSHAELTAVCNTATDKLFDNVRSSRKRDLTWFDALNDEHDGHVAIIGGGPSVADHIREIQWRESQGQQIWVLNNAHKALPDGLEIDAQVLLDARPENAKFVTLANEYLIASQCAPEVFDAAKQRKVTLWHVNTPGMAELLADENERVTYLVGGGTTVGMNAIALAFHRGFRQIHLYGFDSSYREDKHHGYPQALNDADARIDVLFNEKSYVCAQWMIGQANEFSQLAPQYVADGAVITVHGTGLLPDVANHMAQYRSPAEIRANEILKRIPKGSCGIEIGVFAGDLSRALLSTDPDLHLTMVDSWEGNGEAYCGQSGDWHATLTQAAQDDFCARAKMRVKFAGLRANILRKRSVEAAALVGDGSRDFVFIDADHSYEGCKADIETWLPKLKPNGLIGGHDYQNPDFPAFGVTRAVDEFVQRHSLQLETGENFCWFVQLKGTQDGRS